MRFFKNSTDLWFGRADSLAFIETKMEMFIQFVVVIVIVVVIIVAVVVVHVVVVDPRKLHLNFG